MLDLVEYYQRPFGDASSVGCREFLYYSVRIEVSEYIAELRVALEVEIGLIFVMLPAEFFQRVCFAA